MRYSKGNVLYDAIYHRWVTGGQPGTFVFRGTTYRELDNGESFVALSAYGDDFEGFEANYGSVSNRPPERRLPKSDSVLQAIEKALKNEDLPEGEPGETIVIDVNALAADAALDEIVELEDGAGYNELYNNEVPAEIDGEQE